MVLYNILIYFKIYFYISHDNRLLTISLYMTLACLVIYEYITIIIKVTELALIVNGNKSECSIATIFSFSESHKICIDR